jgi:hypothetical protein
VIEIARKEQDATSRAAVAEEFQAKLANLAPAAGILDQVRRDYDTSGEWERLDDLAARLDYVAALQADTGPVA